MEENGSVPLVLDGRICSIRFGISTVEEICTSSISDSPISHPSQLMNPFLGLPLESGKCESCGTSEHGKCEGHFGYIKLPIPIYHPSHVSELKHILSLVCLKCLRMKKGKVLHNQENKRSTSMPCLSCLDVPAISIKEIKTTDGATRLELKVPSRSRLHDGVWNFLDRYGFHYGGDALCRPLLPYEVLQILKNIPEETKKRLTGKGYFPQNGFILQCLPVPPNCLSVPDISNGTTIMSSDLSSSMLRKVLNKIEIIKRSRSGGPNFESYEIEANDLQSAVANYMQLRGTAKAPQDVVRRYGAGKELDESSTKAWLEKMRTLFIRKGSGFSSRSVITGDAYKGIHEIGLPLEIAQKITFEEKVTTYNKCRLQELVDNRLCVTYRDGSSTYAIREGSKGHTYLKEGQTISRRIMDGDIVFINRPPSTHKHSLQAFSVYVHDDHTVKINPLICAPLGADFDGDCVHIFYPQSLAAKAEVLELFSVEKQIRSSHSGSLNLQLVHDSLLSLKLMSRNFFLNKATAQQFAMCVSTVLPEPALLKSHHLGPLWTILQIVQSTLPASFDCFGERHLISNSEMMRIDFNRDLLQSSFTDIITSVLDKKGPEEVIKFFNMLQPLLMEILFLEGYSIGLNDFDIPKAVIDDVRKKVQDISPLLLHLRSNYNELVELQVENDLKSIKRPVESHILKFSALGNLIDSKSDSAISKVVQQVGFLGLQLYDRGKFYSRRLAEDMTEHFKNKYCIDKVDCPSEAFGLVRSSFFQGLNPYEELVHSISSREVLIRSSRGLTEPGTLFKNLMAILRDVIICYDGTVRNLCSNSIIQFEYGQEDENVLGNSCLAGEPVGVLAATAVSNPAYKAVLDSSQSNNSSWQLMKEILLCKAVYHNDTIDRRVILYVNDCFCGKKYCKENAAFLVQNHLKRVTLKDVASNFSIEYRKQQISPSATEVDARLVGHIHLDRMRFKGLNLSMDEILQSCQEVISCFGRKKHHLSHFFKRISLSSSECCTLQQQCDGEQPELSCLQFSFHDGNGGPYGDSVEKTLQTMADAICPFLLEILINGDPRVNMANIIWLGPDATAWVRPNGKLRKGEVAVEVVIEKDAAKQSGDAWRLVMDSCLPVIELIDMKRSIPYGLQQIQKLLGISCAFDQSVQRLSTSIKTVAKGVLKEHLMLVANSMTCTGNLIGFNAGGYKALFHSLKVQVPFTAATLFRPIKCFERAAERCHFDSLSSIVASCSWGKHVAIGTGTPFQILWSKKEVEANQDVETNVYEFLHLVKTVSGEKESSNECLGEDVDNLYVEDGNMELCVSPEYNSAFEKPMFDDVDEVQRHLEDNAEPKKANMSWGQAADAEMKSNGWGGWGPKVETKVKSNGWGGSGQATETQTKSNGWDGWGQATETQEKLNCQDSWKQAAETQAKTSKTSVWSSWDSDKMETHPSQSAQTSELPGLNSWSSTRELKKKNQTDESNAWGVWDSNKGTQGSQFKVSADEIPSFDSWNKTDMQQDPIQSAKSTTWGKWKSDDIANDRLEDARDKNEAWARESEKSSAKESPEFSSWNRSDVQMKQTTQSDQPTPWGTWKSNDVGNESGQDTEAAGDFNCWNQPDNSSTKSVGWDADKKQNYDGPSNPSSSVTKSDVWGSRSPKGTNLEKASDIGGWNEGKEQSQFNEPASSPVWISSHTEKSSDNSTWKENKAQDWSNRPTRAPGWGSSGAADRKNQRSHSTQSPARPDGRNANGILTATGRRLDIFTSEEEKILSDVEPIMLSMRRILRNSSYSDGARLSDEDQSCVLENVFQYHPDKMAKMQEKIDYVMIDKHHNFQGTRCFYVISTNGFKADFSYIKCMENFVKEKYPENAEVFNQKYFKKRGTEEKRSTEVPSQQTQ